MSTSNELFEKSQLLRNEASALLNEHRLGDTLTRYGILVPTGGYYLDLMATRDLDLYLCIKNVEKQRIYELVHEMAILLQPHWLEAKSTIDNPEPDFPRGYFIGMETRVVGSEVWNIDVLVMSMEDIMSAQAEVDARKRALDAKRRAIVLEIKSHRDCGKRFHSVDVYNAVISGSVDSMDGFECWLQGRVKNR